MPFLVLGSASCKHHHHKSCVKLEIIEILFAQSNHKIIDQHKRTRFTEIQIIKNLVGTVLIPWWRKICLQKLAKVDPNLRYTIMDIESNVQEEHTWYKISYAYMCNIYSLQMVIECRPDMTMDALLMGVCVCNAHCAYYTLYNRNCIMQKRPVLLKLNAWMKINTHLQEKSHFYAQRTWTFWQSHCQFTYKLDIHKKWHGVTSIVVRIVFFFAWMFRNQCGTDCNSSRVVFHSIWIQTHPTPSTVAFRCRLATTLPIGTASLCNYRKKKEI